MSIANRIAIAARVVVRFVEAGSLGNPADFLEVFRETLTKYSQFEDHAVDLRGKLENVLHMKHNPPAFTSPEVYEAYAAKIKGLRDEIPRGGQEGSPFQAQLYVQRYGFDAMSRSAEGFCLAVLQQLAMPPKVRKAIEAAGKFWSKSTRRFKPKARSNFPEENTSEWIDRYIEDLELYRKYERLFDLALEQGKAHSSEGEGATSITVGPFTVVNTGGFAPDVVQDKIKLIEKCVGLLQHIGLGKVCYGNVLLTNRVSSNAYVQAFYHIPSDELFVRADAKVTMDAVQAVCHELAHRYEHKFMPSAQRAELPRLYGKIEAKEPEQPLPHIGDSVFYEGKTMNVVETDYRRKSVKLRSPDDAKTCMVCGKPVEGHQPDAEHKAPIVQKYVYTMPVQMFNKLTGLVEKDHPMAFVTPYAKSGGPGENFAEMVAFYAMGKLPSEQVELLKPLL